MTVGEESIVIGMLRDFRREVTARFDALDEREDRQDERIAAIETHNTVSSALARAASEAAAKAATQTNVRWGRVVAVASVTGTVAVAVGNILLRLFHL